MDSVRVPYLATILLVLLHCHSHVASAEASKRLYVIYMGERQHEDPNHVTAFHHDTLSSVLGSKESARESIIYSYKHGFSGFAAMLTDSEANELSGLPGVVHVAPSREIKLQTTRSWDFLGVHLNQDQQSHTLQKSKWGEDVIVGIVDTGIWPESRSFADDGYGPVPSRWKGTCQTGEAFDAHNCSKKIIGARWYTGGVDKQFLKEQKEYMSARDLHGHGTHTASTAVGSPVLNASHHGLGAGTARGGAPRARLAVYKIGWGLSPTGNEAGILAAIDDAIHDGVDVLSLSLAAPTVSFGSFHAVAKGIVVVYAGGNQGPTPQTVVNVAPWVITVAASSVDRVFPTRIMLGNNQTLVGQSLNYEHSEGDFNELADGVSCNSESLNGTNIKGKVILCIKTSTLTAEDFVLTVTGVLKGGGAGIIYAHQYSNLTPEVPDWFCKLHLVRCTRYLPVVMVDFEVATVIRNYIEFVTNMTTSGSRKPMVQLNPAVTVVGGHVLSPKVASFSSRGPNTLLPAVLKPDIAAPGVTILGARRETYMFSSGTSMATPHIAAVAALLKSVHRGWSPAAIKSAIMTTADNTDAYGYPILAGGTTQKIADPFDFGSGHVNPKKAMDPGLVYDIDPIDYQHTINCTLGLLTVICNSIRPAYHLNLPSISVPDLRSQVSLRRTVTNVGWTTDEVYRVGFQPLPGVEMDVRPRTLVFNATTKRRDFDVAFKATGVIVQGRYVFGSLTWTSDQHVVRIPIVVRTVVEEALYSEFPY